MNRVDGIKILGNHVVHLNQDTTNRINLKEENSENAVSLSVWTDFSF